MRVRFPSSAPCFGWSKHYFKLVFDPLQKSRGFCLGVSSRAVFCLVRWHANLLCLPVPGVLWSLVVLPKFSQQAPRRHRAATALDHGWFPPSLHFTASGSTRLPSFTAGRFFYKFLPDPPLTEGLLALHPLREGAFTRACH